MGTAANCDSLIFRRWAKSAMLRPPLLAAFVGADPKSQLKNPIEILTARDMRSQKKAGTSRGPPNAIFRVWGPHSCPRHLAQTASLSLATEGLFSTRLTKHQPVLCV